MVYTKILQCCKGLCFVHVTGLGDLVGLKLQRGTWRNDQSVAPCQCHCLLWGFKPRLVHDFQRIKSFHCWYIVPMFCRWTRHYTLACFTCFRCNWIYGRTEMTIYTIRSSRNFCKTDCMLSVEIALKRTYSMTKWNVESAEKSSGLISDYKLPSKYKTFV